MGSQLSNARCNRQADGKRPRSQAHGTHAWARHLDQSLRPTAAYSTSRLADRLLRGNSHAARCGGATTVLLPERQVFTAPLGGNLPGVRDTPRRFAASPPSEGTGSRRDRRRPLVRRSCASAPAGTLAWALAPGSAVTSDNMRQQAFRHMPARDAGTDADAAAVAAAARRLGDRDCRPRYRCAFALATSRSACTKP